MIKARKLKASLAAAALALGLSGQIGAAGAALLTWRLNDVRFDDGGTATGFFVYDTEGTQAITPILLTLIST